MSEGEREREREREREKFKERTTYLIAVRFTSRIQCIFKGEGN
jgi:hypothetical protein